VVGVTDDTGLETGFEVRRVLLSDGVESWTVVGRDFEPVEVLDRYLAWLTALRSPRTVEGYARDLRSFWCFLAQRSVRGPQRHTLRKRHSRTLRTNQHETRRGIGVFRADSMATDL
jgi:site-specific recombinase XerC